MPPESANDSSHGSGSTVLAATAGCSATSLWVCWIAAAHGSGFGPKRILLSSAIGPGYESMSSGTATT
eukprot:3187254-Prymnesium_polylepis.1